MEKIKYDFMLMKYIALFENVTGAKVKDSFLDEDSIVFVVNEGEMGKAIGKGGVNVKKVEVLVKKKLRIIEFSKIPEQFVKNLVYPVEPKEVRLENGDMIIVGTDTKSKGVLIGRNASKLQKTELIVKRYFDIKALKVM